MTKDARTNPLGRKPLGRKSLERNTVGRKPVGRKPLGRQLHMVSLIIIYLLLSKLNVGFPGS